MTIVLDERGERRSARTGPFVGLSPYFERDAEFFFGREREIKLIAAALRASPLTVLYGPSGVGKSSLLFAGVVHELRRRVLRNRDQVATDGDDTDRAPFAVAAVREWRERPLETVADAILASVLEAAPAADIAPWTPELSFCNAIRPWTKHVRTFLVVFDQFEDYLHTHADERGPGTLAYELPRVLATRDLRVHFLVSLRSDELAALDRFRRDIPDVLGERFVVQHLDRSAGSRAVILPIDHYAGPLLDRRAAIEALAARVLDEVRVGSLALVETGSAPVERRVPGDRVEAPFLQLVMSRLWYGADGDVSKLSVELLQELGGAEEIVREHLKDALGELEPTHRQIAADVFRHLVTPSKTKYAASAEDLAGWTHHEVGDVEIALAALARGERRILRPIPPPTGAVGLRYEITHDLLVEPILESLLSQRVEAQEREKREAEVRRQEELRAEEVRRQKELRTRLLRWSVVGLSSLLGVALVLLVFLMLARRALEDERDLAVSREFAAKAIAQLPLSQAASLMLARRAVHKGRTPEAEEALRGALLQATPLATLQHAARPSFSPNGSTVLTVSADGTASLWSAGGGPPLRLAGHRGRVLDGAFTADGRWVVTTGEDATARVWDVADGRQQRVLKHPAPVLGVTYASDGRVATAGADGVARVWDPTTGKLVLALHAGGDPLLVVAFSARGDQLVAGDAGGAVNVWSARGRLEATLRGHESSVFTVAFMRSGAVVSAGVDGTARVWTNGRRPLVLRHGGNLLSAAVSPAGDLIVTGGGDGVARVWDVATGVPVTALGFGSEPVTTVAFSRDGRFVVTGRADGAVAVWTARTGIRLATLRGHRGLVNAAAFSPDGRRLVTSSDDHTARIWDGGVGLSQVRFAGAAEHAAFSPDGTRVVTFGGSDGEVRVWDARPARVWDAPAPLRTFAGPFVAAAFRPSGKVVTVRQDGVVTVGHTPRNREGRIARGTDALERARDPWLKERVSTAAFGRAANLVVVGGEGGRVTLLDIERDRWLELPHHRGAVNAIAVSADGRRIGTASSDETARVWSTANERSIKLAHENSVVTVSFSANGDLVVTATQDGHAFLWDAVSGKRLMRLPGREAVLSPDGSLVLTGGDDGTARIWRTDNRELLAVLRHEGSVLAATFSPDGKLVVTAGSDGVARIWGSSTGLPMATVGGHAGPVTTAVFDVDGKRLLTAGADGTAQITTCAACSGHLDDLLALGEKRERKAKRVYP